MPEGDTIHQLAGFIAPRLEGQVLTGGELRDQPGLDLSGRTVARVYPRGKHLFVELADGLVVRSHLGMHGSWHHYAPEERWKRPRRHAGIVLSTKASVFVCFHPAEIECLQRGSLAERDALRRVPVDLIADDVDFVELVTRARKRHRPETLVVDVLLDQAVAGGVGNVYKSEALFLERVLPETTLGELDDEVLAGLLERAQTLLRENLRGGARRTRPVDGSGDLWVYGRGGRLCLVCGALLEHARLGRDARDTYWCRRCATPSAPRRSRDQA